MDILQKKDRNIRNEIPVCFTIELKKPTNAAYLDVDFSALCRDHDILDNSDFHDDDAQSLNSGSDSDYYNEKGQPRELVAKNLMAKGIGYDISDIFIDDSEAVVPPPKSEKSTYYGGYFVNVGEIRLKAEVEKEENSDQDEELSDLQKTVVREELSLIQPPRMVGRPPTNKVISQPSNKADKKLLASATLPIKTKKSILAASNKKSEPVARPRMTGRPPTKCNRGPEFLIPVEENSESEAKPSSSSSTNNQENNITDATTKYSKSPAKSPIKSPKKSKRSISPQTIDDAPLIKRIKSPKKANLPDNNDDKFKKPRKPRQLKRKLETSMIDGVAQKPRDNLDETIESIIVNGKMDEHRKVVVESPPKSTVSSSTSKSDENKDVWSYLKEKLKPEQIALLTNAGLTLDTSSMSIKEQLEAFKLKIKEQKVLSSTQNGSSTTNQLPGTSKDSTLFKKPKKPKTVIQHAQPNVSAQPSNSTISSPSKIPVDVPFKKPRKPRTIKPKTREHIPLNGLSNDAPEQSVATSSSSSINMPVKKARKPRVSKPKVSKEQQEYVIPKQLIANNGQQAESSTSSSVLNNSVPQTTSNTLPTQSNASPLKQRKPRVDKQKPTESPKQSNNTENAIPEFFRDHVRQLSDGSYTFMGQTLDPAKLYNLFLQYNQQKSSVIPKSTTTPSTTQPTKQSSEIEKAKQVSEKPKQKAEKSVVKPQVQKSSSIFSNLSSQNNNNKTSSQQPTTSMQIPQKSTQSTSSKTPNIPSTNLPIKKPPVQPTVSVSQQNIKAAASSHPPQINKTGNGQMPFDLSKYSNLMSQGNLFKNMPVNSTSTMQQSQPSASMYSQPTNTTSQHPSIPKSSQSAQVSKPIQTTPKSQQQQQMFSQPLSQQKLPTTSMQQNPRKFAQSTQQQGKAPIFSTINPPKLQKTSAYNSTHHQSQPIKAPINLTTSSQSQPTMQSIPKPTQPIPKPTQSIPKPTQSIPKPTQSTPKPTPSNTNSQRNGLNQMSSLPNQRASTSQTQATNFMHPSMVNFLQMGQQDPIKARLLDQIRQANGGQIPQNFMQAFIVSQYQANLTSSPKK